MTHLLKDFGLKLEFLIRIGQCDFKYLACFYFQMICQGLPPYKPYKYVFVTNERNLGYKWQVFHMYLK